MRYAFEVEVKFEPFLVLTRGTDSLVAGSAVDHVEPGYNSVFHSILALRPAALLMCLNASLSITSDRHEELINAVGSTNSPGQNYFSDTIQCVDYTPKTMTLVA